MIIYNYIIVVIICVTTAFWYPENSTSREKTIEISKLGHPFFIYSHYVAVHNINYSYNTIFLDDPINGIIVWLLYNINNNINVCIFYYHNFVYYIL